MEGLEVVPIYKSLHKPNLVFGCEREPVLIAALIPLAMTLSAFSLLMLAAGVGFWIICSFFLRIMAKRDPLLTKLWIRFIKHQGHYPAKTSVWWVAQSKMK